VPDVTLGFYEAESLINTPTPQGWGMLTGEIGTVAQTINCPCTGEISALAASAPCTGEIGDGSLNAPTNALGVHLGHGKVMVRWNHDNQAAVSHFEVYAGLANGGPYFEYPIPRTNALSTFLSNVPIGITLFLQVRAVGHNGSVSAFSPVKRGVFTPIEGTLRVKAVSGTTIDSGVRFSSLHPSTKAPVVFKAVNNILVS